jgi:hypothetical protein
MRGSRGSVSLTIHICVYVCISTHTMRYMTTILYAVTILITLQGCSTIETYTTNPTNRIEITVPVYRF